jgi:Uncharacterized protein conserved in archaea
MSPRGASPRVMTDRHRVLALPFIQAGSDTVPVGDLTVALGVDRDWFTPAEVETLIAIGVDEGVLRRDGELLHATFDYSTVEIPSGFTPSASVLEQQSPFERLLARFEAEGVDRRSAVAAINARQQRLSIPIELAAALELKVRGLQVPEVTEALLDEFHVPAGPAE